jgi:anaerobic magnesium-protoporphyrin IX monomethyl ester cyclase
MRVLLVNPPSPEQLGSPLLGQQYVAAALLARGCEVRILDAAARYNRAGAAEIVAAVDDFRPDVVAFGLFTRWVWHAYQAAREVRGKVRWLIAGGAHTTALPREALDHGFDVAFSGEAEHSIVRFIDFLEGRCALESIPGVHFRDGHGPPAEFVEDLDSLAAPLQAQLLYDSRWYDPSGRTVTPGGVITSRGCPARCTFCANYVTGRGFRHRSTANVVSELNRFHALTGASFFPFWDDALTANVPRLLDLCHAFRDGLDFPISWSAITRANMVTPALLDEMKAAGCLSVNFGVESGDDQILRVIKKGVSTTHVVRALEWAKERGMLTACNFMLGFPQETAGALLTTRRFMERIAPLTDFFSTLGVVVPFPGTPIYDDFHRQYGFTNWWLEERNSHFRELPSTDDLERYRRIYVEDANLDLDFFRYAPEVRSMIRECLRYKGEHNLRRMGLVRDPLYQPVPAAAPSHANRLGPS